MRGGVSNVNKVPALRTSLWGLGKCEQCKQSPSFKDISVGPCEGWGVQRKQGPSFKDISVGPCKGCLRMSNDDGYLQGLQCVWTWTLVLSVSNRACQRWRHRERRENSIWQTANGWDHPRVPTWLPRRSLLRQSRLPREGCLPSQIWQLLLTMAVQDSLLPCLLLKIDQEEPSGVWGCIYIVGQISDCESWWFGVGGKSWQCDGLCGTAFVTVGQSWCCGGLKVKLLFFHRVLFQLCPFRLFASSCSCGRFDEQAFIVIIFLIYI